MAPATQYLLLFLVMLAVALHLVTYFLGPRRLLVSMICMITEAFLIMYVVMLLTTDEVSSDADRLVTKLGWPFNFVEQNQSRLDPPYPYDMNWAWEVPTKFHYGNMALNWVIFFAGIYLLNWVSSTALQKKANAR